MYMNYWNVVKTQPSIRCMNYIESIVHLVLFFLMLQICWSWNVASYIIYIKRNWFNNIFSNCQRYVVANFSDSKWLEDFDVPIQSQYTKIKIVPDWIMISNVYDILIYINVISFASRIFGPQTMLICILLNVNFGIIEFV